MRSRSVVLVALVAGVVAGCSGSDARPIVPDAAAGESSTPSSDVSGSTSSLVEDPAVRVDDVLAMDAADRDAALVEAGLDMELAVAKESGLEAELGGPDATRAALIAAWAPVVTEARGAGEAAPLLGFRRNSAEPPSLGEGFFGGFLVVGLGAGAAASAAEDRGPGAQGSETRDGFTLTTGQNQGELSADLTHLDDATGVTTKMSAKVTMSPCPDADGRFAAHATLDVTASKGSASQRGVLDVDVVGYADDNANLASSESEYTMTWSQGGGGAGSPASLVEVTGGSDKQTTVSHPGGGSSGLDASARIGAQLYATLIEHSISQSAERAWQSGQCVRLDVTSQPGPKAVKPGGTAEVGAAPRSKVDGTPVGGTVTASFEGVQAIEPNGSPLPADATFVYTAPGTDDRLPNNGTVSLEARSRRGVAMASITFEVDRVAYVATGSGDQITFSGTVTDTDFFTVTGEFVGGSATFEFAADRDAEMNMLSSGVVSIAGGGSGATVTGSGTYSITVNDNGTLTVTMQTRACVDVSGQCRDSTATITLTPQS